MRYFSNSLTITELSKSETTVESAGLALLSKYILQVIGWFNRELPEAVSGEVFLFLCVGNFGFTRPVQDYGSGPGTPLTHK